MRATPQGFPIANNELGSVHTRISPLFALNQGRNEPVARSRFRRSLAGRPANPSLQDIVESLKEKDSYTWGHSLRVSTYATAIAFEMGLTEREIKEIQQAGELHDIGKLMVPTHLLRKVGPLNAAEYRRVSAHSATGAQMLLGFFPAGSTVVEVARSHHERIDGRGGPDGLSGRDIPFAARIVAVADSYDAMTSSRPYRPRMPQAFALMELELNAGSQFDVDCVAAFERSIHSTRFPVITSILAA